MDDNLSLIVFDGATGFETIRELTPEEIEERNNLIIAPSIDEIVQAKKAARESALAKLAALGLTEEEIAAL